jgi:hypothetical protein
MKAQSILLTTASALVIGVLALNAHAQTSPPNPAPPQQTASGTSTVATSGQTGDVYNGGYNGTAGEGSYLATDPYSASGNASAAGKGASGNLITPTGVIAHSTSVFKVQLGASGQQSTISFKGLADQGNWSATTNDPAATTYASGGNGTQANIQGSDTEAGDQCSTSDPISGDGTAAAKGKTVTNATGEGTQNAAATVMTAGKSDASGNFSGGTAPTLSSSVSGMGAAGAGALASGPNGSFGSGAVLGGTSYNGMNSAGSSAGSQQITGATHGTVSPTGNAASATATVSSAAQAL